jgi:hypothetical protein
MKKLLLATVMALSITSAHALSPELTNPNEKALWGSYMSYIMVKECYEAREYKEVYISAAQFDRAKRYVAAIDEKLNLPNKDKLWQAADSDVSELLNTQKYIILLSVPRNLQAFCLTTFGDLQRIYQNLFPGPIRD